MPIRLRKILGAVSLFLLVFVFLVAILCGIFIFNDIGDLSFSHGDLPSGNRIELGLGLSAVLFLSLLGGIQSSMVFFRFLSKQVSERKAALMSMLPVVLLVVLIFLVQWNVMIAVYLPN